MKHFDVVALGELLIDFAPLSVNEAGYPVLSANPGGAPGNFLAALTKYGCRTAMIGKVGDDAFGKALVKTLGDAGIDIRGILVDPDVFTTLAFVSLDASGNRDFSFARKPGADTCLTPEEVDEALIADTICPEARRRYLPDSGGSGRSAHRGHESLSLRYALPDR